MYSAADIAALKATLASEKTKFENWLRTVFPTKTSDTYYNYKTFAQWYPWMDWSKIPLDVNAALASSTDVPQVAIERQIYYDAIATKPPKTLGVFDLTKVSVSVIWGAMAPLIAAQNALNLALAKNQAETASIAALNKSVANMSLSDADVGTLLQLDYLQINEPTIYANVVAAVQNVAKQSGTTLSGLGDFWSNLVSTVSHPFQVAFDHIASLGADIVKNVQSSAQWAKIVFPQDVLAKGIGDAIQKQVLGAWDQNQPLIQKLVKYSPVVLLNRQIVPDNVYQASKNFENQHRQEIKVAAAVAAVVTGVIATDPSLALNVADLVDTGVAKVAAAVIPTVESTGTAIATQQAVKAATANLSGPAAAAVAAATSATVASGMNAVYSGDPLSGIATTPQDVLNGIAAKIPDAAVLGSKIGDTLNQYISKIGPAKVQALVAKYTATGPITSASDPRFAQLQADLVAAANNGQASLGTVAAANQSTGVNWKSWIVPGLAVAGFLFK